MSNIYFRQVATNNMSIEAAGISIMRSIREIYYVISPELSVLKEIQVINIE